MVRQIVTAASWGMPTALDVGSGAGPFRPMAPHCVTMDACEAPPWSAYHYHGDLLEKLECVDDGAFAYVQCLDVIEHLEKNRGWLLLEHLARIACRRALLFTPNGFRPQESDNPYQVHRSGWTADELRSEGWSCAVVDFDYDGATEPGSGLFAWLEVT